MITASIDSSGGLTVHRVEGTFTIADLRDAAVAFVRDAPTPMALWDFTAADFGSVQAGSLAVVFDGVRPYAENRRGARSALLFSSAVGFGLGRMSEALAEVRSYPYPFKAFSDREAALHWLRTGRRQESSEVESDGAA
jgi:hypothetical protein